MLSSRMSEMHCCWKDVNRLVFFCTVCFGLGSWITINGLWVELPSIVPHVPEGWALPSYLSVIGQIANIGPIAVTLIHYFAPGKLKDTVAAYGIIGIGALSCILLSFTWDTTGSIGGSEHSVALLVLVFFTSLADCTSSVVFIPFMSIYKPVYMTALYVGEGMSGLLPGFVALGQAVGQYSCQNVTKFNQTTNRTYYDIDKVYEGLNFPVRDFFFFLAGMMVISGIGFTMLNYLPQCKKEQIQTKTKSSSVVSMPYVDSTCPNHAHALQNTANSNDISTYSILYDDAHSDRSLSQSHSSKSDTEGENFPKLSKETKSYLLLIIGVLSFAGNGLLTSTSTYSSLPYGEKAYHLSVTLSNIANPLACMLAFLLSVRAVPVITCMWTVWIGLCAYSLYLAATSPYPVLVGTLTGSALMVTVSVVATFIMSYIKVCIAILFREQGKSALVWLGGITQLGAFLGSVLGYILVNVGNVFEAGQDTC